MELSSSAHALPINDPCHVPAKRPLRTYSKRSQAEGDGGPHSKRRRGESVSSHTKEPIEPEIVVATAELSSRPKATAVQPTRQSIRHYFRPISSKQSSSRQVQRASSFSSSPPKIICGEIQVAASEHKETPDADVGNNRAILDPKVLPSSQEDEENEDNSSDQITKRDDPASSGEDTRDDGGVGEVLGDCPSQTEHRMLGESTHNILNRGRSRTQKKAKTRKKPMIQMTLSLGRADVIVECKDCHVLYNTSHEQDVKYHKRRHATIVRQKASE